MLGAGGGNGRLLGKGAATRPLIGAGFTGTLAANPSVRRSWANAGEIEAPAEPEADTDPDNDPFTEGVPDAEADSEAEPDAETDPDAETAAEPDDKLA